MINVTDLRNGTYFQENGTPYQVISYGHTKMGRGNATVKVKVKDLKSGAIITKTYISGKRVEEADIEEVKAVFIYRSRNNYIFKDEDGKEFELPIDLVREHGRFLKKNLGVAIELYEDDPISIRLPIKVSYKVKEAPPDARGNTSNASAKEVALENNLKVKTPMFVKVGDKIVVDTRSGTYVQRI